MNKRVKRLAACGAAAVLCLGVGIFAACSGEKGDKGDKGDPGTQGIQGVQGIQGEKGEAGTKWFSGNGLPTNQTLEGVKEGDYYINLNTNTIYTRSGESWNLVANINDVNNVSKWDGTIPGWTKPNLSDDEIKANRPVSYVVDSDLRRVDLYNAEAFAWFAYRAVLGKEGFKDYTVNLYCDVDLDNKMWVPIGLGARSNAPKMAFQGTFNGNGHTIYNLNSEKFYQSLSYGEYTETETSQTKEGYYIAYTHKDAAGVETPIKIPFEVKLNRDEASDNKSHEVNGTTFNHEEGDEFNYGLFAKTYNATIKNLNLKGVKLEMPEKVVTGSPNSLKTDSVGALIGFAQGSITVENCTAGQFEHDDSVGFIKNCNTVGGIIGRAYGGTGAGGNKLENPEDEYGRIIVKNCTNNLNILGSTSAATGPVASLRTAGDDKAGGIISMASYFSNMVIEDCVNNGDLNTRRAGGIVSYNNVVNTGSVVTATVRNCTNNGKLTVRFTGGGIIGDRQASGSKAMYTLQNCTNRGDIVLVNPNPASGYEAAVGGLVGGFNLASGEKSIIVHSNNSGNVIINSGEQTVTVNAGALVGLLKYKAKTNGQMTLACANNGDVIDMRGTGSAVTLKECNLTGDDEKVCVGYATNKTIDEQLKIVYLVNIGARRTQAPAA